MTTTKHADKVKQLRSLIRRNVCSSLRVVMSRGSAWGNVKIKGSGEFGEFNENEKSALSKHNFNYGANCGIIMYEDVPAVIRRLQKSEDDESTHLREEIKEQVNAHNSKPQPRTINIAAITDEGRTIGTQVWTRDIAEATAVLDKWLTEEKWYGRIALAMIADPVSGRTSYRRHGEKLYALEVQP
jgi:hypothetical protein